MVRNLLLGFSISSLIACAGMSSSPDAMNRRLIKAAEEGRTDEVISMIKAGANIEAHDAEGFTPYLAAASKGRFETMKLLKGLGAKTMVDEKFIDGRFVAQSP